MILFSYDSEFRREGDREGLLRRILEEIPAEHPKDGAWKLTYLDEADNLQDLAAPPGNRLEALKGTAPDNIAFALTTSGAFASAGNIRMPIRSRSPITTNVMKKLSPIHPGEVLLEDFMKPLGLSQYRLAADLAVAPLRISQIVRGKRAVTANPLYALPAISEPPRVFGFGFRCVMIWRWLNNAPGSRSTVRSRAAGCLRDVAVRPVVTLSLVTLASSHGAPSLPPIVLLFLPAMRIRARPGCGRRCCWSRPNCGRARCG